MSESLGAVTARRGDPEELLTVFDGLEADQGVVYVTDSDPRPLLAELQRRRAGSFEWSTLEDGPDRFRIEIRRRPAAAERTVSDYLEYDHRRLDSILPAVLQDIDNGDCAGAAARFAEFACGLNHHIEAEEQILFPSFEERTGMRTGPTMVMRAEHVEIRRAMRQVGDALAAGDSQNARSALAGLVDALSEHNMKEEHVLYPMTDEVNAPGERDALVKKMQAL